MISKLDNIKEKKKENIKVLHLMGTSIRVDDEQEQP